MILILVVLLLILVWGSKVVHSLYFGKLRDVPSPLVFQIFPVYYKYLLAWGHGPYVVHEYYLKFGPVFRVGWHTVLFTDMEAANAIYGGYQFNKGVMYEGFNYFGENILSLRNRELHAKRKKILAPSFTKANLELVEERIIEVGISGLFEEMDRNPKGNPKVNMYNLVRFMLWDVTADISLGKSLGMLQGKNRQVIDWVAWVLKYGIVCAMFPVLKHFKPDCLRSLDKIQTRILSEYMQHKEATKDFIAIRNIDRFHEQMVLHHDFNYQDLVAESHIMLISGTDAATNSLASFIYLVLKHPRVRDLLIEEIQTIQPQENLITYNECKNLIYLEAAMREALRLLPVAAIPLPRETPQGGRVICDHFIPEKTEVAVPIYSLHRSAQLWEDPTQYIPERWIHPSNTLINHGNYMPFSLGPRGCIGKELAVMEMKMVVANLLKHYHLSLHTPQVDIAYAAIPAFQPKDSQIWINAIRK